MLKQNIKIFFRNIKRQKSSFFINIIGLSTGLTCVLLIYLWASDELAMDTFHENSARLYQVRRNAPEGQGGIATRTTNSSLMLTALQQEVPEVEMAAAVYELDGMAILQSDEKKLRTTGIMASEDFFKIFNYKLLSGDKNSVLKNVNSILISKKMALGFFGEGVDPRGKTIKVKCGEEDLDATFTVSGVFKIPAHSSMQFDCVMPYKKFLAERNPNYIHWGSNSSNVYALLKPGVAIADFNKKMAGFIKSKNENTNADVLFTRYSNNYLKGRFENGIQTGGRIDYVKLFGLVGLFVLVIACINFMNLSTARASRRLKEVGVKKAIGADRKSLIFQFLTESTLLAFFALGCALLLVLALLPWFNQVTGKELQLNLGGSFILIMTAITLLTGLFSGSYPALYLSKFNAVKVLKGKINTSFGELFVRKGLVVAQFGISVLLIVAVGVVYLQLNFVQSKNLGYNKDNVLLFELEGELKDNLDAFLKETRQIPGVANASYMQGNMTNFNNSSGGHTWPGQSEEGKNLVFRHAQVGPHLIETMGLEMKEGRSYADVKPNDDFKVILNETAIKQMGLKDPIGKIVHMRGSDREIIGVVKDFNTQSLYQEIVPTALLCTSKWVSTLAVKLESGSEKAAIGSLKKLYANFNPGLPFEFRFLDAQYQELYVAEQRVSKLSKYFAGLAILISCLGLYGLTLFTAERRRKEISIRKVLGQTATQVTVMISSEFAKLVMISIVIALPIAYLLAKDWLSGFAYHIPLQFWYFIGAGLVALTVAMLTVGSQAVQAANRNPVEGLREE